MARLCRRERSVGKQARPNSPQNPSVDDRSPLCLDTPARRCYISIAIIFTNSLSWLTYAVVGEYIVGRKDANSMPPLDILFRQVPEGFEFLGVLFTILGSLIIMVILGAWWSR